MTRLYFVAFLLNLLRWVLICEGQSNMCLWYRSGDNSMLNGEFVYAGTMNGASYYSQSSDDCSLPQLYLYLHSSGNWFVSDDTSTNSYYALCDVSSISNPSDCGDNWYIGSDSSIDSSVTVTDGLCPVLGCSQLSLSYSDGTTDGCTGDYTAKITDNVYRKLSGAGYYLYFNYKIFEWMCHTAYSQNSCFSYIGYSTSTTASDVWSDLSDGESLSIAWLKSNAATKTAILTCSGSDSPTPSPVSTPTASTPTPTSKPTSNPTASSTSDDICMWYRGDDNSASNNLFVNGKYSYKGSYNGYSYYQNDSPQDCNVNTLYLYYHTSFSQWFISPTLGSNSNIYAKCSVTNIVNPLDCSTQWIFGTESSVDSYAQLQTAPCPSVDCTNGISLDIDTPSNNICSKSFTQPITVGFDTTDDGNIWARANVYSGRNYYLYFNYKIFKWECSTAVNFSSCYSAYGYDSESQWFDGLSDNSAAQSLQWNDGSNNIYPATIQCAQPTPEPTPEPTDAPTRDPTDAPTDIPTRGPTPVPTPNPTHRPTNIPTRAPTDEPTTPHPTTAKPTLSPTAPTAPTDVPTIKPTSPPTTPQPTLQTSPPTPPQPTGVTPAPVPTTAEPTDDVFVFSTTATQTSSGDSSDDSHGNGKTMPWWAYLIVGICIALFIVTVFGCVIAHRDRKIEQQTQYTLMSDQYQTGESSQIT